MLMSVSCMSVQMTLTSELIINTAAWYFNLTQQIDFTQQLDTVARHDTVA